MIITLDGPACSGKSTLAVRTAEKLNIHFLNTGMIFRAIAYLINENGGENLNEQEIGKLLSSANIDVEFKEGNQIVYINGIDTSNYVSLPKISYLASHFSKLGIVRDIVKNIQHKFATKYDLVVEGRDIGTEIFPNAEYKFFIIADIDARAKRRYETLKQKNNDVTLQEVEKAVSYTHLTLPTIRLV